MRLELSDLPPWAQEQALKQLAEQGKKEISKKRAEKPEFDSRGEYEFYIGEVVPKMAKGEIVECDKHPHFTLLEETEYNGQKFSKISYRPDFMLKYADGTVEIIEIKSRFVKRMQRDYHIRKRIFIEKIRPWGWKFREVITDEEVKHGKV